MAVAFYVGCVGLYHSYVMQHGGLLNEVEVKIQFGMLICYVESLAGYGAAVAQKDVFQLCIVRIILVDNLSPVHFLSRINCLDARPFFCMYIFKKT